MSQLVVVLDLRPGHNSPEGIKAAMVEYTVDMINKNSLLVEKGEIYEAADAFDLAAGERAKRVLVRELIRTVVPR